MRRPRGDGGTILILSIGFCVIALLLVYAVVAASDVFLARRDLAAAVDGTALAAAQQVDVAAVYDQGTALVLPLDRDRVASQVARYVAQTYPGEQITGRLSADGRQVLVHGARTVSLPGFGRLTVVADARAASTALDSGPIP